MGRIFRISPGRRKLLYEKYLSYGCSAAEAEKYASAVFDCKVMTDDSLPESEAWEIDFSAPASVQHKSGQAAGKTETGKEPASVRSEAVKKRPVVYASWLKGGWNRIASWEMKEGVHGADAVSQQESYSAETPDIWDNPLTYHYYMSKNHRTEDPALIQPGDLVLRSNVDRASVRMEKLPCRLSVLSDGSRRRVFIDADEDNSIGDPTPRGHVFLLDVSGSMGCRLMLVQLNMAALFHSLETQDTVTVITYSDDFRLIDKEIPASDPERFQNALSKISFAGGYGRKLPVLQRAYQYLNSMGLKGTVTLFSDGVPDPGRKYELLQREYARREESFGIRLNVMIYGSDSWADSKLSGLVRHAGGRLLAVLEPDNIRRALTEHWLGSGKSIYDLKIRRANGFEFAFGCFPMTQGASLNCAYPCDGEENDDEQERIIISWRDSDGRIFEENLMIPVTREGSDR